MLSKAKNAENIKKIYVEDFFAKYSERDIMHFKCLSMKKRNNVLIRGLKCIIKPHLFKEQMKKFFRQEKGCN